MSIARASAAAMRALACLLLLAAAAASAVAAAPEHDHEHEEAGNSTALMRASAMPAAMAAAAGAAASPADACVARPTSANCSSFAYKYAAADVSLLCTAMPFMAACSMRIACQQRSGNVSATDDTACEPFQHLATVCKHDAGMSKMAGCRNFNSMCGEGSKVPQCSEMTGMAHLPTTRMLNKQVRSICEDMPNHTGCDKCLPSWRKNATWGDCDLLATYGSVCSEMPDMAQCDDLKRTCESDASLWVCEGLAEPAPTAATAAKDDAAAPAAAAPAPAKSAAHARVFSAVPLLLAAAAVVLA